ncbi:trehalose-phosphatase [Streptomyces sp. NPDC088925]|uniref:trehalose-phosphatase n=1 Tax=Streptomyces sp. NPDC088925 TaxID=3365914 RepID=UPI00380CDFE5
MTAAPDPHSSRSPLPEPVTEAGRAGLRAVLDQPSAAVVALDFDGTLADIVPDPDSARARPGAVDALARLAPHVRSIAVVTGRPAETAVRYGGFAHVPGLEHLVVLGLYGAERWDAASGELTAPPPPPGLTAARAELPAVLAGHGNLPGLWTEDKGQAVAVHTRRAEDPQGAYDALLAPLTALAARHGLIVEPGRMVLELRPPGMDKGKALTTYLDEVGAASVLYAGDDLGDLAAYAAVEAGRPARPGLLLASGTEVPELTARADLPLAGGPEEVVAFLSTLADTLS